MVVTCIIESGDVRSLTSAVSRVLVTPHTRRVVTTPAETEARLTRVETLPVNVNIIIKC